MDEGRRVKTPKAKMLLKYNFRTASYFAGSLAYLYVVLVAIVLFVHIHGKGFAVEALGTVAHLYATDGVGAKNLERQAIEYVFYILNTVEVTVVVDVAVERHKLARRLCGSDACTAHALDRTLLISAI